MKQFENYLDICIITYNRASYLEATIDKLLNSPFERCKIYVCDNCSTDNTQSIVEKYGDKVEIHRNRFNIGLGANIMRALEYGVKPYIWILGDDDDYDFEQTDDLIPIFSEGEIGLIQVGAHTDVPWNFGGQTINTRTAVEKGYPFFRFSSFIGCDIYKRDIAIKFAVPGYNNIVNTYPHMPLMLSFYEENKPIYISKGRIAKAVIGNQSYNGDSLLRWWGETCKLLKHRRDQKECFFQQFFWGNKFKMLSVWRYKYLHKQLSKRSFDVALQFFSFPIKVASIFGAPCYGLYRMITGRRSD